MATQAKLDKDARRRRRDQCAGSSRKVGEPERTCGNCYAYAVNYCAFYQSPARASNRAAAIRCREHRFEDEI